MSSDVSLPASGLPVCGNCGQPLSLHFHEDKEYCFDNTTGDVFTDEPTDQILAQHIESCHPELHAAFVAEWRRISGHPPKEVSPA